ncbi:hypothetical protein CEXT_436011 [Caerostris extrusa]|uniref:Uncharacterized protein n=1 Tax=Caerostris extrusa TaxID=172846 RepID=A0AAV4MJ50_CAEEX|nr:hypothetical protein CEXT_436011 [Caerostris extrusa]
MYSNLYVERMDPVVLFHEGSANDDTGVSDAGQSGDDPHADPEHHVVQQVAEGADAVAVGLAHTHVTGVRAQVEVGEVAARTKT